MPNANGMLSQVAENHAGAKGAAKNGGNVTDPSEELPQGASPVEEGEETSESEEAPSEEASEGTAEGDGEPAPEVAAEAADDDEGPIRIGDREFTSSKEAIKYAEELEREKLISEAHHAGIREALEATRKPEAPVPEPEDDFEQRFYTNPKGVIKEVEEKAVQKALSLIDQQNKREKLWKDFLDEHPDIRRKDAERILQENWETIGKMTDLMKAQKALASRVRAEYEEIRNLGKPRTELPAKKQVLSPSGGKPSVTPAKKEEKPLSFAQELRSLRKTT